MTRDDPRNPEDQSQIAVTSMHVRRAMHGDDASLDWVVGRLSPLLIAQARYRLGRELQKVCEPEDLVQEAWLVALPRLPDLSARDDRFTPVLLKMLSTALLHQIRNLVRKQTRHAGLRGSGPEPVELNHAAAKTSGVVSQAIRRERADQVTTALQELEEKDREVIILCGIEQVSPKAAGAILGLQSDATRMRYRRALDRLRTQLGDSVFDEFAG